MPASSENVVRAQIRVAPSAPLELMWLFHFIGADHPHYGSLGSLEQLRQRYGENVERLWRDHRPQESIEMIVLAHRSGTLMDQDLKRFFSRVDGAMEDSSPVPSLRSESPAERKIIAERLARLRSDLAFRKRYVDVLQELWSAVHDEWEGEGRDAVRAQSQKWARALDAGTPYRQLLQTQHIWPPRPETDVFVDEAATEGNLTLTPTWFGGKIHVLELNGLVNVGRGIRHGEPSLKEVAIEVSSHIKALADPTRLAILMRLARDPASVTEIARQFNLSQPTVSAHVQVLREAGLLEEKTVGRTAQLSANQDALHDMFAHTEEMLVRAFRD